MSARSRAGSRALLLAAAALACAPSACAAQRSAEAAFTALAEEYLGRLLERDPGLATRLGVHDHDARLVPVTQVTLAEDQRWFAELEQRLLAVNRASLPFERTLEYDLLLARTRARRLDLEVIRPYQRNPAAYVALAAGSVQSLLQRDFAPVCDRLRAAAARLRQIPEVLRAAKINLENPPRVYTQLAIVQFDGVLRFYREGVPQAAAGCRESRDLAELAEADSLAVRAVEDFLAYLREDLLPRSGGEFALGRETYQKKLLHEEMVETPVESLLARGWRGIEATHAAMESLAQAIQPGATAREVLAAMGRDHPGADSLVSYTATQLERIRAFLRARDLITLPEREDLRVRETPPFGRALGFASMDPPGVWERKAAEAFYNVTPPDSAWEPARQEEHLSFFNRWASEVVSIHEALPGHYYQFLALRQSRSRLRQALTCGTFTEGWAHYCEQMMLEEGYGAGDPRYRMAQLSLALQRLCRLVAGISLHTQGMTPEEVVALFRDQGWMTQVNAEREARRGTADPTYLVYTVGKWEILALREEMRARLRGAFRLKDFHDALLREGAGPLPLARRAMTRGVERGR